MTSKKSKYHSDTIIGLEQDYKKHGDGIQDLTPTADFDPRFQNVLGTGISRRNVLQTGAAMMAGCPVFPKHLPLARRHLLIP